MIRCDYHVHTRFCDGQNSPEEIVRAALSLHMTRLGFSAHSHIPFEADGCLTPESTPAYRAELLRLREAYRGRIKIFLGIEQDHDSAPPTEDWDFVIGSVHYLRVPNGYVAIDDRPELLIEAAKRYFGGDLLSLCEAYYEKVGGVAEKTRCDLIGHFDLITKFQERVPLFDEQHPRYVAAWQRAADRLLKSGVPFEVNTGAISRGYRSTPYPSPEILRYLQERGAAVMLSSDSHSAQTLCCGFETQERILKEMNIPIRTELARSKSAAGKEVSKAQTGGQG